MSFAVDPLKCVLVKDNRTILDNERVFAIVKGGRDIRYRAWPSNNVSSSFIQWSCPPPAGPFIMDRRVKALVPVRLVFTGTVAPGQRLLNPNRDAPRQFPLHSATNTFQMTINDCGISQNVGDMIHALLCFNTNKELLARDYSQTPSCPDRSQSYNDLVNEIGNPLSMAGDSNFEDVVGRGGFAGYKVVYNPVNNTNQNATLTAYVDILICEQVMLSPCYYGNFQQEGSGFMNVTSFDFTINFFNNGANRMWSHAPDPAISVMTDNSAQMYFKDFPDVQNYPFTYGNIVPLLLINYITPSERLRMNITPTTPVTWPYFSVVPSPTDVPALAFGTTATVQSNNYQLGSLPRRIMIYARPQNNKYMANPSMTDCFYKINNITINFNNRLLLAECTPQELYNISRKNHLNLSYSDFIGQPLYKVGGNTFDNTNQYYGRGTILCFEPALDFGLNDNEASGMGGQWNFQIQNMSITNINSSGDWDSTPISIYILFVYEGAFTIQGLSHAVTSTSIIGEQDVLSAVGDPSLHIDYNDTQKVNGGNFYSNIKDIIPSAKKLLTGQCAKEINKFLKDSKVLSKGLNAASYLPIPLPGYQTGTKVASDIARNVGYGQVMGGEVMGGKMVKHGDLYAKLKKR